MLICTKCHAHLSPSDAILSKSFHGQHGRAFLVEKCINIHQGPSQDRALATGLHTVADVRCNVCDVVVGWRYLHAYEESQKYKVNKVILEVTRITSHVQ